MRRSLHFEKDHAVSVVLGGMLLVIIAVAAFALIYINITSEEFNVYNTNVRIDGSVDDDGLIVLEHKSGETIESYKVYISHPNGTLIGKHTYEDDNWDIGEIRYPLQDITDIKLVNETISLKVAVYAINEDEKEQEIFKGELFGKVDSGLDSQPPDEPTWDLDIPLLVSSLQTNTIDEDLICYTLPTCINFTEYPEFYDYDIDMNWQIDNDDADLVESAIGLTGEPGWIREDVDNNGVVDANDLDIVESYHGLTQLTYIYNWIANGKSIYDILLPFDTHYISLAPDYSGKMANGIIFGPTWSTDGIKGGAYDFDGNDDYMSIPYCFNDSNIDEITVETWVKTDLISEIIASYGEDYWEIRTTGGKINWVTTSNDEITQITGNTSITDSNWHYIATTYDYSTGDCIIYVDGEIDKVENMHNPGDLLGDGSNPVGYIGKSSSSTVTGGWDVLTYDDFENGFGNYEKGGRDCYLYTSGTYAHQGNKAAGIQDNSGMSSSFYHDHSIDVHTPEYTSIKVDFWFAAESMEYGEDFWVRYYDGDNWIKVADYDCGDEFVNDQFYHEIVWINETEHDFPTNMRIRFQCDASMDWDDVYIDQIYVNATSGSASISNYSGMIDEFKIYNRVLSAEQIYQNYISTLDSFSDKNIIVSDEISNGNIWQCIVTPNDSTQDGQSVESESLQIGLYEGG